MQLLNDQKCCDEIFNCLQPSWCLSLTSNIVHLAELSTETEDFEKNSSTILVVSYSMFVAQFCGVIYVT